MNTYYMTMVDSNGKFVAYYEVEAVSKDAARIVAERGHRYKAKAINITL